MLGSESRAISRYLAHKYSDRGPALIPRPGDIGPWAWVEQSNFDDAANQIHIQKGVNQ